jgi:oxygen-dependent protoporphyrinogen oxidase
MDHDESVASFLERHYGSEMVDRLTDPLLSGIYGGDAAQLSVRAVLPRFVEMERIHGSLGRAMLGARKKKSHAVPPPIFTSLKNGMQSLADAVVKRLAPSSLRMNTRVLNLECGSEGWSVSDSAGQTDTFDAVIVAVPTHSAADILRSASAELSSELGAIAYSSTITVALGYGRDVRQSLPPGFGFLVPRSEGKRLLAATFVHNKFLLHRAPPDRALLRCFFAGGSAENIWRLTDNQIAGIMRSELQQIVGLRAEPFFSRVYRWKSAMAQYGVGHLDRLDRIERLRQQLPGLALCGNGYRGIGIPDCIRSGRDAASQLLTQPK